MKLVVPKEITIGENRVGVTPDSVPSLKKMGFDVFVESDAGLGSSFTNEDYKKAGAKISKTAADIKNLKPVEPYKAKGIKERGQFVLRKEGKKK